MSPAILNTSSMDDSSSSTSQDYWTPFRQPASSESSFDSQDVAPEPAVTDPSVIVGMACRLPGATNTSQLWKVLAEKRDLQRKMPEDRFNVDAFYHPLGSNKGTTNARYGYFLDQGLDEFDASFFNISGKEAEAMDPQQRLLLEVVYEALENAGITLDEISGSRTSVYCGSFTNDYNAMTTKDLMQYPKYTVTGVGNAVLSNRISYCYNLHGPSMTLDTACSSSLVCFHLGNQSLRSGESDMTIVAGTALHFDPTIFITMTDFGMLSTDGRCRTFDAVGSGYVRGEGVCAAILKKQSAAEAAGDPIRAIIRGTGSNHDGLKDGLTLPNAEAQARLLQQTYKSAGLSTADTHYFEAHGTGTQAGDPREAKAIGSVFAPSRGEPLIVGSVKSNLGHLEGASGLAGIIKATLSLEHGKILPNMHFNNPNPQIDFKNLKIQVPTEMSDWKSLTGIRRASINSFGYGGSNAHVILENYRLKARSILPQVAPTGLLENRPYLLPLTSHSEKAGKLLNRSISSYLQGKHDLKGSDLAYSYSVRRTMHSFRSYAIGYDQESFLRDLAEPKPVAAWSKKLDYTPRIGFVFTGQGAQWYAMGRQLIEKSTLFLQTLERCDEILQQLPDAPCWSCVTELMKSKEDSKLSQSLYSQTLCAAVQLAIVDLLKAWHIQPSAVVGHSSGEIVAAYSAGILSFKNAIICAYYRGVCMSKGVASTPGAMMAVGMTEAEGIAELRAYEGRIALAAINSPSTLTLSGDEDAILKLKKELDGRKVFARQLQVEQAFHSHHMVPLAPAFELALSNTPGFRANPAKCQMFSSVTARDSSARKMDAAYWAANMTGMVRFSDALTGIVCNDHDERNVDVLVEIGAHPALKGPSKQTLKALGAEVPYIASLSRDVPAFESLLSSAGQLFALGYPVNLAAVNSDHFYAGNGQVSQTVLGQKLGDLPTYSWDHGKYWAETRFIRENRQRAHRHTLLGSPMPGTPGYHPRWRNYLRQNEIPWLSQHVVDGKVIFPAAGYISIAIEAISTVSPGFKSIMLRDVVFKSALEISGADAGTEIMLDLEPQTISAKNSSSTWYWFVVCSFDENYRTVEHCHGLISAENGSPAPVAILPASKSFTELQKATNRCRPISKYYQQLQKSALQYGYNFQLLSGNIESGPGFSIAPMTYRPADIITTPADACLLHPTILDSSFHAIFAAVETALGRPLDDAFVPTFVRSMSVSGVLCQTKHDAHEQEFWVKTDTKLPGSRVAVSDLCIQSQRSNDVLVDMKGFEVTALGNESAVMSKRSLFFRIRWMEAFDRLGTSENLPTFESIADIVDCYAHQFPDARILHITPGLSSTKLVLSRLGGSRARGDRRRFQSITPYSTSISIEDIHNELESEWPGLVQVSEPKENDFDLAIINEAFDHKVTSFVKTNGFVISEGAELSSEEFIEIFRAGNFRAYQKAKAKSTPAEHMTLVLSPKASLKTSAIASAIEYSCQGAVTKIWVDDLLNNLPSTTNIISLVSLDEDIFFDKTDESSRYNAIQKLLTCSGKNIVWLLQGSSQESANPAQALMVGLIRASRSENETTRLVSLDLPLEFDIKSSGRRAVEVLDSSLGEEELALRDGKLLIPRVEADDTLNRKLPNGGHRQPRIEPFKQERKLALKIGKVGLLDTLQFEDDDDVIDSELADDEVEIDVKASALNFRDIAASIGIIDDYRLGDECSGIITRIGRNVNASEFKEGDRVLAWRLGQGAHRSIVRNPAPLTQKIEDMDFVTATTFPCVLTTAYYSLLDVARLQPGEYCLVHAAAGGVGQMAVQLAQMVGANVIATVGSQNKRDYLKEQFGLKDEMIFSSRDPSFVDGVLKVTNGRGCDVALNSLAGELLHATWGCIAPFGRLIEIGKRDIHENTKLDMDPFRKNIAYASVDLITIYNLNASLGSRLVHECYRLVKDGKIMPPGPITEVSYAEAQKGFRMLQMGKYFGKVVLVPGDNDMVPVVPPTYRNMILFDPEKFYLLVGGLGGIGRALSEWMVQRGARRLAFLSRSGASLPDAKATIDWLTTRGVEVSVFKADVTNMEAVMESVRTLGDRLAGIFQAAMVLQDTPFSQMKLDQWRVCVYPKVQGTYNLHRATANQKLDFFVCFSSASSVVGAMGQANYSAANSYLDALMRHRQQCGLPGFTMNVGRVSGVGVVAEDAALEAIMDRIGYEAINEEELFYQIEEAVTSQSSSRQHIGGVDEHQIITGINMSRKDLYWSTKSLFRNLYANHDLGTEGTKSAATQSLSISLRSTGDDETRTSILMEAFIEKIAAVLAVPASTILAVNPLSMYGLDSIVAVEFRKWFSKSVGVELALFDILGAKSIKALVSKVSGMITASATAANEAPSSAQGHTSKVAKHDTIQSAQNTLTEELLVTEMPKNIPMSSFQNRMWFLHNMLADPSSLNFAVTCMINGQPQLHFLQQALYESAQRNDILRTSYFEGQDFSEQAVLEGFSTQIQTFDVSTNPEPLQALKEYTQGLRDVPLDIESGDVMRSSLVKLADAQYALVFIFHHIALDNGSTKSSMDQMTKLYDVLRNGKDISTVAAPKISYAEFSVWHKNKLESPQLATDIKWWRENFTGAPSSNKLLPFAQSQRSTQMGTARRILKATLELPLLKRMKRVCARMDVTPFQFLLAAFRAFVHRYTQEDDLTILMVDGNRPHTELDDVLGFFVNMIPLRCKNDCDTTFDLLLSDIKQTALDALSHSQVPFDTIVDAVQGRAALNHFPLGQVVINYQMYGKPPKYRTSDFDIYAVTVDDIPTACDMALEALEDSNIGLNFRFEYDSYLYDAADMDRFFENFSVFIKSTVRDFRQPISEIEMCGPKELQYLRANYWGADLKPNDWNDQSVWARVAEVAKKQPHSTAIRTSSGETINFQDLLSRAEQVAYSLRQAGALPGQQIGILFHPGIDMISAMMGVTRIRCGYLPLDPEFAKGRLSYMIQDSGARFILIGGGLETPGSELQDSNGFPSLIPISSALSNKGKLNPILSEPADPFYTIYTSGSTGKPKGVTLSHENTQSMLSSHNHVHAFSPRDTILFYTSMSFDISVAQVWSALTSGATLAIASQDTRKDPAKLGRFMREAGTTISYMTPTQFSLLLEHNSEDVRACSSLRHAILAGEAVPTRLVKAIYDLGTPITIFNQYGPSEATCQTTFHKVNYPKSADFSVPIGHGMKNCSHYIVDNNLKPVPAYVTGELCIGGAQVGAGYLNRPEATDEVFVEDPFASEDFRSRGWTKLYRTGDKARFLADGQLDFKGRISGDKQIKLRGYRIDLAEIENELHVAATALQGPRLLEVVVLPRHLNANDASTADERQLIAFLVLSKHLTTLERQILVNALHKAISVPLNVYMRPSGYQLMDTLPKLISGKIDRQMLLQKRLDLTFPSSSATPSFKEAESTKYGELLEIVTQTFKTLLKLPANHQVSDTDNFFEVGGHSVLLLRLKGSLKTQLNVDITLIELFEEPTVIGITKKIIKKSQFGGKDASIAPILDIEIDWNAETILPNDSRYQPRKGSSLLPRSDLSEVVVTGADSFSGIHMLQELLFASPSTTVYAMPSEKTMSLDGLAELFEQWNLFNGEVTKHTLTSRVKLVQGSLIMPHFGLDENQFTELGQKVQAIYHVGGQISLLKSYTELKRANVGSVLDLIELASHGRTLTEIHYLSTWSVAHLQSWSGAHRTRNVIDISENSLDHFRPSNSNKFGYFKSRWVAEMLLGEASRRNFPVTIYRASAIAASTSSALAPPDDNFTNNMVLDMIATGKVPSFDNDFQESRFSIDFIPMDYLASTVVRLSTNDTTSPLTLSPSYFHISNPSPVPLYSLPALISQIRTDGKPGQSVPVAEWVEQMRECAKGEKKQLEWAVFKEYLELGHRMFSLDGMKAREAVGRINVGGGEGARRRGVKCPPVDAGYLRDMMARRRRSDVE